MAEGGVRIVLRIEGLALLVTGLVAFHLTGASWWWFAVLFLVPDLTFAAYLAGARVGAFAYNAMHTTALPLAAGVAGLLKPDSMLLAVAAVWLAHIGMDRALGYGLKYATAFSATHLGRIGRPA
jgi:hypothetical protein